MRPERHLKAAGRQKSGKRFLADGKITVGAGRFGALIGSGTMGVRQMVCAPRTSDASAEAGESMI